MTQSSQLVFDAFLQTCKRFYVENRIIEESWNEIAKAYSSPSRFYHTLEHLGVMHAALAEVRSMIGDFDAMIFALVYHDFIYRPLKSDNEVQSAELAVLKLSGMGIPGDLAEKTRKLILCTRAHETGENGDENFFVDADLAILGSSPEEYGRYATNVRREYQLVPDILFKPGRRKVLDHFLQMQSIYKTAYFQAKLESAARQNLLAELKTLE